MEVVYDERKALAYGLAAVGLWSTVATGFKLGLAELDVVQLLFAGACCSWLVFFVYALSTGHLRPAPGLLRRAAALGMLNPCAYYLVLFAAYDRLPAHVAQPLNYTWAITLALLAVPILKQPLSMRLGAGIVVSYCGVVLLLMTSTPAGDSGLSVVGVLLALGSTLLWAGYWLLSTRYLQAATTTDARHPAPMMLWSFTFALPPLAALCWFGPGLPPLDGATLTFGAWVGCIEMGVTFIFWQLALRQTAHTARIGQLIFLSPFASLLVIYSVLGEQISAGAVAGLAVIVAGLMMARPASAG